LHEGQCVIRYSRAIFELQWRFAERVAAMSGMPHEQALLYYTNFYIRFGLGREFDVNQAVWRIYIDGLTNAVEPADWAWRFFLTREPVPPPSLLATSGWFSYSNAGDFSNAESLDCSPSMHPSPGSTASIAPADSPEPLKPFKLFAPLPITCLAVPPAKPYPRCVCPRPSPYCSPLPCSPSSVSAAGSRAK
jgi:hypothetical protein